MRMLRRMTVVASILPCRRQPQAAPEREHAPQVEHDLSKSASIGFVEIGSPERRVSVRELHRCDRHSLQEALQQDVDDLREAVKDLRKP